VPVEIDDNIYKTAFTRGLDVEKHISAYSIILNIKKERKKKKNTHMYTRECAGPHAHVN